MQKLKNIDLFHAGEDLAAIYLTSKGYEIVCRNFRTEIGEIDIIVKDDKNLVFVEVKTRSKHSIRQAMRNVAYTKQKRLSQTAQRYIMLNTECVKHRFRFDVIILLYFCDTDSFKIEHLEDAFTPILE